jgi:hypothetical protein
MAFDFDKPLHTLSFVEENKKDQALWEEESLGGITEDNNRLPVPVVWLLLLTVLTAFAITFPLWGQRPNAGIYADYVRAMNTPEIMAIQDDKAAMAKIVEISKGKPHKTRMDYEGLLARHPLSMDDLRIIKPQIEALMAKGLDLEEYTVVGDRVVIANFEGNYKADGARERKQPWWDKGYTIDIFYVIMFFIGVTMVIKCLPPYSWQPTHNKDH